MPGLLQASSRAASFLSLRQATSREVPGPEEQPETPDQRHRQSSRQRPWRRPLVCLTGILLLGLWCTFTVDSRRLDRANFTLRKAAREAAAASAAAGNATHPPPFMSRASDCARALSVPQVALMFLVKDEIYHEVAWMLWLEQAAGVAPGEALAGTSNDSLAACAADGPWRNASAAAGLHPAVAGQNLFTLYVHTHADHDGPAPGSLFYGAVLPREQRIATTWGGHSLVTATKALLRAALSEPLNAKLLLISETTVPIYSPHLLYRQLLSSPKSMLNACNESGWSRDEDQRATPDFETAELKLHHWRKSWQWFALVRPHAQLVLRDAAVERQFERHCRPTWVPEWNAHRVCYSDEHYIPTLLAVHGLDNETDCQGLTTHVNWDRRADRYSPHPYEYTKWDIRYGLIQTLRRSTYPQCSRGGVLNRGARAGFAPAADGPEGGRRAAASAAEFVPLGGGCPLLARKFMPGVGPQLLALLLRCHPGLAVLNPGDCHDRRGLSHQLASAAQPWAGAAAFLAATALLAACLSAAVGVLLPPRDGARRGWVQTKTSLAPAATGP